MDFETFADEMGAVLEGNGFERAPYFGQYGTRAPDDAEGFVKGKAGVVFFDRGEGIEMEILIDMREDDWSWYNSLAVPEGVAGDREFQKFLLGMLETVVDLEAL